MIRLRLARTLTAVAVAVAVVAASANPAGAGQWTDPTTWGSGTTIGVSYTNQGNVVGLWQLFLSTRYRPNGSSGYVPSFTGSFNSTTSDYTKVWQYQHSIAGLSVDGIVGPATWSAARFFHVPANPYQSGSWKYFQYYDSNGYPGQVSMPYAMPYATWFFYACVHPSSSSGSKLVEWTDIDLPTTSC